MAETQIMCPDCEHHHTPDGCTGPPSPSDRWAGVTPSACDCDTPTPTTRVAPVRAQLAARRDEESAP